MKIVLENTDRLVQVGTGESAPYGRVWEGHTESGIYVQCVIVRIAAPAEADLAQFQRELTECRPPFREEVFPLRMVI